jgi:preprotein translocase subunit SecE
MAKDQALPPAVRPRTPSPRQTAAVSARAEEHAPRRSLGQQVSWLFSQFPKEVRAETRKITWPSWRETWITSVMVAIMVVITSLFFMVVDFGLSTGITWILKFGGGS